MPKHDNIEVRVYFPRDTHKLLGLYKSVNGISNNSVAVAKACGDYFVKVLKLDKMLEGKK